MPDLAQLELRIQSLEAEVATQRLEKLQAAAKRLEGEVKKVRDSVTNLGSGLKRASDQSVSTNKGVGSLILTASNARKNFIALSGSLLQAVRSAQGRAFSPLVNQLGQATQASLRARAAALGFGMSLANIPREAAVFVNSAKKAQDANNLVGLSLERTAKVIATRPFQPLLAQLDRSTQSSIRAQLAAKGYGTALLSSVAPTNTLSAAVKTATERKRGFLSTISSLAISLNRFRFIVLSVAGSFGAFALIRGVVGSIASFEKGLINVAKTTGASKEEIAGFEDEIKRLSIAVPIAVNDLLSIATTAGQLGIRGSENIIKFTETIGRLTVATNLTADEAASTLARLLELGGQPVSEVERLGNVIVRLGNEFNATETEIARVALRIAQAGTAFGISSTEAVTLATAFRSVGVTAERAGSAVLRAFQVITEAVANGGERLELLGRITAGTADQFRRAFEADSIRGFEQFIEGLGRLDNADLQRALRALGLDAIRVGTALSPLARNANVLNNALDTLKDELRVNNAAIVEAERAFEGLGSKLTASGNAFRKLADDVGDLGLTAALKGLLDLVTDFIAELLNLGPSLRTSSTAARALVAALQGVLATLTVLVSAQVAALFFSWVAPLTLVTGLLSRIIALATGLGTAFLALVSNPFGAIAVAIGGAVAAISFFRDRLAGVTDETKRFADAVEDLSNRSSVLKLNLDENVTTIAGLEARLVGLRKIADRGLVVGGKGIINVEVATAIGLIRSIEEEIEELKETGDELRAAFAGVRIDRVLTEMNREITKATVRFEALEGTQTDLQRELRLTERSLDAVTTAVSQIEGIKVELGLTGEQQQRLDQLTATMVELRERLVELRREAGLEDLALGPDDEALKEATDALDDLIERTELQIRTLGQSAVEVARLEAEQEALNVVRKASETLIGDELRSVEERADKYVDLAVSLAEARKNTEDLRKESEQLDSATASLTRLIENIELERSVIGQTAVESARLRAEREAANLIAQAGTKISDEARESLDRLAKAYVEGAIAVAQLNEAERQRIEDQKAEELRSQTVQRATDDLQGLIDAVQRQRGELGKTGVELEKFRAQTEALAIFQRAAKDATVEEAKSLAELAAAYVKAAESLALARKAGEDAAQQSRIFTDASEGLAGLKERADLERRLIGQTAVEQARLRAEVDATRIVREAERKAIEAKVPLSDSELLALNQSAAAYVAQAEAIARAREAQEQYARIQRQTEQAIERVSQTIADSLADIITATKSVEEALKDLVLSFVRQLTSNAIKQAIQALLLQLTSLQGQQGGGVVGGILRALGGTSGPAVGTASTPVVAGQRGAIIDEPSLFIGLRSGRRTLAGEAGPEVIAPVVRTPGGDLGVRAVTGGRSQAASRQVVIQGPLLVVNTPNADSFRRNRKQITSDLRGTLNSV